MHRSILQVMPYYAYIYINAQIHALPTQKPMRLSCNPSWAQVYRSRIHRLGRELCWINRGRPRLGIRESFAWGAMETILVQFG